MDREYNSVSTFNQQDLEPVVTFGQWFKMLCISFLSLIPGVGGLITLIVYIIVAADSKQPKSLRNAVIAYFIIIGIMVALVILLLIVLSTAAVSHYGDFTEQAERFIESII